MLWQANASPLAPAFQWGHRFRSQLLTSDTAPCNRPGKAQEDSGKAEAPAFT